MKYFLKKIENNFKTIVYDLDGFNQEGFNRKWFDRNGFELNGFDENGFNRIEELACEEKFRQPIRKNPWNIYHTSGEFRNKYEIMNHHKIIEIITQNYCKINEKESKK